MNVKSFISTLALGTGLAVMAAPASSAELWSFEDDDIDFILDDQLNVRDSGDIVEGDIFVSIFEIPTFNIDGSNAIPAGQELTGVAAIQLVGIDGDGGAGTQYVFAPVSTGLNSILGLGTGGMSVDDGDAGEGAILAMYLNSTGDFDLEVNRTVNPASNCTDLANCIDEAATGNLLQVDGFLDPDDFWVATLILDEAGSIDDIAALNNGILAVSANFALSTFFNDGGDVGWQIIATGAYCGMPGYVADGCSQLVGSATITGGAGLTNGAVAHSDFDATKYVVSEPGVLTLLGLSLLGFAGLRRRRQS